MSEAEVNATSGVESNAQDPQAQTGNAPDNDQAGEQQEHLTKAEFDKKLQSETDKRVDEALRTARGKWEKEYKERIDRERKDAERLTQLSAEEREKELLRRQQDELSKKEKVLRQRELKLTAIDILAKEELPVTFADQLIGEDGDDTYERITAFKAAWHEAVEKAVTERLKSQSPRRGNEQQETKKADMNQVIRAMAGRR